MSGTPWDRYQPAADSPWDLARAWTLRRRAGFAATWDELQRDLADGPEVAVGRILDGSCRVDGVSGEFGRTADLIGDAAVGAGDPRRLQAWWLYRILFTPDPLTERLTLMWHDHFATSQLKVQDVTAIRRQNETLRRHARGPFGDLLRAMLCDPALLVWLDAPSNRKGQPNENLARELMELFTLGVGNYTESDVKESARALTGRFVSQGRYSFRESFHDGEAKTILGRTDRFEGDAFADLLIHHPATAKRLAWRLCRTFLGEGLADDSAVEALADRLRGDELHVGRAVETILRSELFFQGRNFHAQVLDPVGFVVGSARAVERFDPPPSTLLLAEWTTRLGLDLFFPPNVGGWPGGRGWLSGRAVVARANFAAAMTEGRLSTSPGAGPPDFAEVANRHGRGKTSAEALRFFGELLLGSQLDDGVCGQILRAADAAGGSDLERRNRAIALLLARPEAQLC